MHLFTAFIPSHCTPSRLPQIIMCSAHCEQQEEGQHPPAPWAQHSTSPLQFPWDTGKLCRTEPLVTSVWRLKGCLIWQLGACCDKGELWTQINCLLMSSIEGSSICDSDCVCKPHDCRLTQRQRNRWKETSVWLFSKTIATSNSLLLHFP